MKVGVKAFTEVINKISNITSGDKQVPGVLLDLSENQLDICYSDGHKSFTQRVEVQTEEGDKLGKIVVDFAQLQRAVATCQPYGKIVVTDISITYGENTITLSVEQVYKEVGEDGNITKEQKVAEKKIDLAWKEPDADMRAAILTRMDYNSIFESDTKPDEYKKDELIEALNKTSTEKSKVVYFSGKTQSVFVQNQAHLTAVPISKVKELTDEEKDAIRGELTEAGTFTDEAYAKAINDEENRIHYSLAMDTKNARIITSVFNSIEADTIYVVSKDKFISMYVDTDTEHIGFWFEMAMASKAHTGAFERYNSLKYSSYQVLFLKDVLVDSVESALKATSSEKVALQFLETEDGIVLMLNASSSQKSIADSYKVIPDNIVDPTKDLISKSFNVSLQVISDMLKQLKTDFVALDFDCGENGVNCIRLAEVDYPKIEEEFKKAREKTKELCAQQAIPFDPASTPTPVELKLEYRIRVIKTRQFTMLAK